MTGSPKLDLASSVINVNKSLIDFVPSSGSLITLGKETYDWFVRERIDESSFQTCKALAHGLAFPNVAGAEVRRHIQEQDQKLIEGKKKAPLRLVASGSPGRLLAQETGTCYMVSTVATLTRFHDPDFASKVLCAMMLDRGGHENGVSHRYQVQEAPIIAVVSKIVDSIYLNVVNAGDPFEGLPRELQELHQHFLDADTFAAIVMSIQRVSNDLVIRSDRFLPDLTLWLLYHFEGQFEISVKNDILFEKSLGLNTRRIRLMVRGYCPSDGHFCTAKGLKEPIEASVSVEDEWFTFVRGHVADTATRFGDIRPHCRQPFYEVDHLNRQSLTPLLERSECHAISNVAKVMMQWILNIPIEPHPSISHIFEAHLTPKKCGGLTIGSILSVNPGLLHLNTGFSGGPNFIVRRPEESVTKHTPRGTIKWFPALEDLFDKIAPRCPCTERSTNADIGMCKKGCLRDAALTRLFILLAHGFCDAFGAEDISGNSAPQDLISGVDTVISSLVWHTCVVWDEWFSLVAIAVAGIPSLRLPPQYLREGTSSWAAAQNGSYFLIALWLDLRSEIKLRGCFSVITGVGNLQGVPDGLGLARCESNPLDTEHAPQEPRFYSSVPCDAIEIDPLKVELYTAIFRADRTDAHYRLMTTVRSGQTIRLIDPSMATMNLARSQAPRCSHDPENVSDGVLRSMKVCNFDELLAASNSYQLRESALVSKELDSHLKFNVLLSIPMQGCIVRQTRQLCISCALGALPRSSGTSTPPETSSWILNVNVPKEKNSLLLGAP